MVNIVKKIATYDDLLELPESTRAEIMNGQIETSAAKPNFGHRYVTSAIDNLLWSRFGGGKGDGWIIEIEPDVQIGPNILSPDLAGWKKIRRVFMIHSVKKSSGILPKLEQGKRQKLNSVQ